MEILGDMLPAGYIEIDSELCKDVSLCSRLSPPSDCHFGSNEPERVLLCLFYRKATEKGRAKMHRVQPLCNLLSGSCH
jgi:hypothetical protein